MKIRSVHPEFFTDQKIAALSPLARLMYIGLWCYANDYGHGRLLLKAIEGQVFPHDIVDVQQLVSELEKRGFIRLYEVEGERFFEIPAWDDWQQPRYQAKTKIPKPDQGEYISAQSFGISAGLFDNPAQRSKKTAQGEGEVEVEVVVEGEGAAASTDFNLFHSQRAKAEVERRAAAGRPITNPGGLAATIRADAEFLAESERLWAHRDCERCGGVGFTSTYAPGSGSVKVVCP